MKLINFYRPEGDRPLAETLKLNYMADLELIKKVTGQLKIPVVALGGAGDINHFIEAVKVGASAVSAGSMFVFQGIHKAVLISYISSEQIESELNKIQ